MRRRRRIAGRYPESYIKCISQMHMLLALRTVDMWGFDVAGRGTLRLQKNPALRPHELSGATRALRRVGYTRQIERKTRVFLFDSVLLLCDWTAKRNWVTAEARKGRLLGAQGRGLM